MLDNKTVKSIEDSKYYWTKTYPVAYYEMDFKKSLKPSAMMNFLQDMATKNAEMLGFGPTFVFSRNYAWFLIKYNMEFDEYPQGLDEVLIKTESRGISKIIANRDFEIWTADNKKRLGRIASQWMLIDLSTKSIVPLMQFNDIIPVFEKRENDLPYNKILAPERIDFSKTFEVRFEDIDVNQHVNNANYIVWAFEALPYEFKAGHSLKTLDIVYKKEIAYGHNIISEVNLSEKTSTHILKNATSDEELCLVKAIWE